MITRIRQYDKKEPSRDAHKLYVICEGSSDEPKYYGFFEGLSLFSTEVLYVGKEIYSFVADELTKLFNKMG